MSSGTLYNRLYQSICSYPYVDNMYREIFGDYIKINRLRDDKIINVSKDDNTIINRLSIDANNPVIVDYLDKQLHIDTIITNAFNRFTYSVQEKILGADKRHYDTLTIEYQNDKKVSPNNGEFFDIVANYYLSGYAMTDDKKRDDYGKYGICNIFDVNQLKLWIHRDMDAIPANWILPNTSDGAKATMIAIPLGDIPDNCYFAKDCHKYQTKIPVHVDANC